VVTLVRDIPADASQLIALLKKTLQLYHSHLRFWRQRVTPASKNEIQSERDNRRNTFTRYQLQ
jgi:hypothetical protein